MMERQVRQLSRLVEDLLDASRIAQDKIALCRALTCFGDALACAIEASRPLMEQRRHALSVRLPRDPLLLDADPVRLTQILANLLNNAAKYTEPGGHVEVSAAREGDEIVCQIRDDGIGIPAEMLGRVFDMFVQADPHSARSRGGLGIGLALVKRLVELHGGQVEAASEGPGRGTQITLRLPAALGA
jgi:signal transduction histidine kinase